MRFINLERTKLPEEILRHNLEEKRKYFSDICLEVEKSDAEVQVMFTLSIPFSSLQLPVHLSEDSYLKPSMCEGMLVVAISVFLLSFSF